MKRILITLIFTISVYTGFSQGATKNFIDQNYIEVIGEAEEKVTPDQIYLIIRVNEKDFKDKELPEIEKSITDKLKALDIDIAKKLTINDFVSNFKYYWLKKTDIFLTKEYELLLHDAKTAGKVFVELEKLGISNISIDRLDHSDIKTLEQKVKIEAIKSAKEKASAVAEAIGQDIGRAIYINEFNDNIGVYRTLQDKTGGIKIRGASGLKNKTQDTEPDIEFDKIRLTYKIKVRFELK